MQIFKTLLIIALAVGGIFSVQAQSKTANATTAVTEKPSAETILQAALKQAKKEGKNVFIKFSASWCGWCHKMDTILATKEVKPLFDKSYVSRQIIISEQDKNLETPGGDALLAKFVNTPQGLPFWVIVDPSGKVITDARERNVETGEIMGNTGCPATKEEIEYLKTAIKASSKLTDAELTTIARQFGKIRNIEF